MNKLFKKIEAFEREHPLIYFVMAAVVALVLMIAIAWVVDNVVLDNPWTWR